MSVFQKIEELINENRLNDALLLLNNEITQSQNNDKLYFTRGKLHWRLGNKSQAITDYEHAVDINPDSPARIALDNARDVIAFFNPDLYNP
ncbi:MAG: tetratricopeptide repeat protein [Muribaculaceae bacterium]|nr:tetratricopeptide repeat protein [Muribaculaceae bacterium]MBQ3604759.1 tetratricopeptide repeat protein [Muribaculaceae bacterium]MBQ7853456.1 tetratricopeptide repeat protein [Muribaculaceae bacterium]MBR3829895.1 tetratricopeptide repeat protein [Muribaculaceae bacterium]